MKTLAQFFDLLRFMPMRWEIQRNDELSGVGSGVVYQAELAPPLWTATVTLRPVRLTEANQASALINSLQGALEPFMFRDPFICGPRLDPDGAILSGGGVNEGGDYVVTDYNTGEPGYPGAVLNFSGDEYLLEGGEAAVVIVGSASGTSLSLTGLPENYQLSIGDKLQITTSGGQTAFVEVSEPVTASALGATGPFKVFPRLPVAVGTGNSVTLYQPACPCVLVPGSFRSGSISGNVVSGMTFSIVQKRGV